MKKANVTYDISKSSIYVHSQWYTYTNTDWN